MCWLVGNVAWDDTRKKLKLLFRPGAKTRLDATCVVCVGDERSEFIKRLKAAHFSNPLTNKFLCLLSVLWTMASLEESHAVSVSLSQHPCVWAELCTESGTGATDTGCHQLESAWLSDIIETQ